MPPTKNKRKKCKSKLRSGVALYAEAAWSRIMHGDDASRVQESTHHGQALATPEPMAGANLLLGTPDEVALTLACTFGNPFDLLRLACACKRYRLRIVPSTACGATTSIVGDEADGGKVAGPTEMWSIVSEAARRWLASCPAVERGWVPRRAGDCWLGLMHELQRLRLPPLFTHKHGNVELSHGGAVATKYGTGWCTAVVGGNTVDSPRGVKMRAGRHFAQFSQCGGRQKNFFVGVITPDYAAYRWDAQKEPGNCFYHTSSGKRWPGNDVWEGMQAAGVQEGPELAVRIGLLLDLDVGTLTVFKNSERLGVMATGLSDEYYWAVCLLYPYTAVRIEAAPCPIPPPLHLESTNE